MSKNIFDGNRSSGKKAVYYVALGLVVAVVGVVSFIGYKSTQDSISQTPIDNKIENVEKTPAPEPIEKTPEPEPTEKTPEPEPTTPPKVESKAYTMPVDGEITVGFSLTSPVYSQTLKDWRIHDGVDIACELGTTVKAVNDGAVEKIENTDLYGITVTIKHTDGRKSVYSNLEDNVELEQGQIINRGDTVGKVGTTAICEISDGPHLHFEMIDNANRIDPMSVIDQP